MKVLQPDLNWPHWRARLEAARERVLMLDYDGTLAPFRPTPEEALPYPGVTERLARIMKRRGNRLVIVSGRPIAGLEPMLKLPRLPELWGGHGWEHRSASGQTSSREVPAPLTAELGRAAARADILTTVAGVRVERKRASVALHWRGLAEIETVRCHVMELWREYAQGHPDFNLLPFEGGIELRVHGANKRYVVDAVLADASPHAVAAYMGDDHTDEEAFRGLAGRGIPVLVREELRTTAASLWLRPPAELLDFLDLWAM